MAAVTQSSSSSSSAQDLLKPDPETQPIDQAQDEDDEDLEALRLAALSTIKAKKPAYVVQAHAKNQNLLAIIPVDDKRGGPRPHRRPTPPLPPEFDASVPPPGWAPPIGHDLTLLTTVGGTSSALMGTVRPHRRSPPSRGPYESGSTRGSWSGSGRRSPYRERRRFSPPKTAQESESEYSEYSEYVTDSEAELESQTTTEPTTQKITTERKVRSQLSKESAKNDEDDVLQVDCTDEFTTFLNEFEEELKEDVPATSTEVKKKKRVVKRRKRVKPTSGMNRRASSPDGIHRTQSPPRRYSRSPYRVRSPYRSRPVSPMGRRRSPSPRYRRSSPGYRPLPRYSRSPRRYSPPSRRRRTPSPHSRDRSSRYSPNHGLRFDHRAGSAPKHEERHTRERLSPRRLIETDVKSRSLPPSREEPKTSHKSSDRLVNGNKGPDHENLSVEERSKAEEEREFQAKLKQLSSPEREKLLARHAEFAQPLSSSLTAEKKVISLRSVKVGRILTDKNEENYAPPTKLPKRLNSEDGGDSISLSVDDTLDMFQEEKAKAVKVTDMRQKLRNKKGVPQPDPQTDLRVQLHQKRRRHVITGKDHLPAHPDPEELSNDKFDESLEHAKLSPSDDSLEAGHSDGEESQSILSRKLHTRASLPKPHKRIVLDGSDNNELETRIVNRSSIMASLGPSPKKKSVMDRLGEPVHVPSVSISGVVSPSSSSPPLATSRHHHHHHHHRHLDARRKVISPVERDHEDDDDEEKSPRDPSAWSSSKIVSKSPSKKDKKKEKREKKEKKKAKKAKKDKKKKRKSTTAQSSDEDDDDDGDERNDHDVQPELNPEEEELFSFFENQTNDI